jgi:hypothetical protein
MDEDQRAAARRLHERTLRAEAINAARSLILAIECNWDLVPHCARLSVATSRLHELGVPPPLRLPNPKEHTE